MRFVRTKFANVGVPAWLFAAVLFAALTLPAGARAQNMPQETPAQAEQQTPPATQQQPETQPAPTTQEATTSETAATEINPEIIQARLTQLDANKDIPEATRVELQNTYRQTLEQIALTTTWSDKAAAYERGRLEAPALLEATRSRLQSAASRPASAPALDVSADATLSDLLQRQAAAEAELRTRQEAQTKLDDEATQRKDRRKVIPDLITDATSRLAAANAALAAAPAEGTSPQLTQAKRWLSQAQKHAIEAEIKTYQQELQFYDARSELLTARRDEARLAVTEAQARVSAWQDLAGKRRTQEAAREQERAEEELRNASPQLKELAAKNADLAAEQARVVNEIASTEQTTQVVSKEREELEKDLKYFKASIETPGMEDFIGPLMRQRRERMISLWSYQRVFENTRRKFNEIDARLSALEDERSDLQNNLEGVVQAKMEEILASTPTVSRTRIEPRIRDLLNARLQQIPNLKLNYGTYQTDLLQLSSALGTLLASLEKLSDFIEQHVLWIRSTDPIYQTKWPRSITGLLENARATESVLLDDLRNKMAVYIIAALVVGALFVVQPRIRRELAKVGEKATRVATDSPSLTPLAVIYTFLCTTPWPTLLIFLSWRCAVAAQLSQEAYEFGTALAGGLWSVAMVVFTLRLIRAVCRPKGLGDRHFRWETGNLARWRSLIAWLQRLLVIPVFIVAFFELYTAPAWRDLVGRTAFIFSETLVIIFAVRLMHPRHGILPTQWVRYPLRWRYRLRHVWFLLAILCPATLAVVSAAGFHYTAIELAQRVGLTTWLVLGMLLVHALLIRWVFYSQRKLAVAELRHKAARAERQDEQSTSSEAPVLSEPKLDLASVGEQTRKLLGSVVAFGLVIGLWFTWSDMLPALRFLYDVHVWKYTTQAVGESGEAAGTVVEYITLAHIALALIVIIVTTVLAKNIPGLLEIALLRRLPIDTGARFAITAISRYAIVVIGVLAAFGSIGVGWSKVQWLVAAITVGLGFGLQEIFANFVSGLILLFERPIRVGDTVTIGDVSGTVSKIRIRATTITGWDRKELVIPNKEFVTGQVINWTLSDSVLRMIFPVGIAYGSNVAQAKEILQKIAEEQSTILGDPPPRVLFMGFGDSSLNFEMRGYIARVDDYLATVNDINTAIDAAFREAGIEIPFPQRDVHVRSIKAALPLAQAADAPFVARLEGHPDA